MSYQGLLDDATDKGKLERVSPSFVEFKNSGDSVTGKYLSAGEVVSNLGTGVYNHYTFDTDNGPVKFGLGGATDRDLAGLLKVGGVYHIVYLGKEALAGAKSVNKFEVYVLQQPDGEAVGGKNDVPF